MNINDLSEKSLGTRLREQLMALLGNVSWVQYEASISSSDEGDFALVCQNEGVREWSVSVECKKDPRPSVLAQIAQRRNERPPPVNDSPFFRMLGAPYITPRLAEVCKENGWGWIDLAGNCRIDIENMIYIERSGLAPVHKRPTPALNFSSPEVARVLRVLLAPQRTGMSFTQRELKNLCEPPVSIGLVNKVVKHLKDEAYLRKGGVCLSNPEALLAELREAYPYEKHQRLELFTLLKGEKLQSALAELGSSENIGVALASFSAASVHAPFVRQPRTWLYASEDNLVPLKNILEAKEVDSGSNLMVLLPSDEGVFADSHQPWNDSRQPLHCTSPIQTYLDLWHAGGRGREAAEAVMEQVLQPAWKHFRR